MTFIPKIPKYTISQTHIFLGAYSMLVSGIRDQDNADVVIKLLKDEHPSLDDIARVRHEYEVAKLCETEDDVVHVLALEKCDTSYALVMENIRMPTLDEVLETEKKIGVDDFLELAIHMAQGLGHIHQRGIIHKDITPSNIMCDLAKKQIKIIDFGLAATLPKECAEILSPNVLEGTLPYISPEQTGRMNRGIDYRTDYYSLGVVFYQMLLGILPFSSTDPMELVYYHIAVVPKAPHELDHTIPETVSNIVMKLLAKKAEDRYQNANGLIADLKECYRQFHATATIKPFKLGAQDIFSRFQIPEKLYGREQEVKALMNAYNHIMAGNVKLMLVAGYSGIGKSSLVHEVHKPVAEKHGYFISGKFDQFKHNIPYSAVTQTFDEFVKQILTESEESITVFRQKILWAVGENGKILVEVIPHLASVIGEQPDVMELSPAESQNRFSYVFQNFIKALSTKEHPLAIFLDDLQWADLPSLNMLETLLTSPDCKYLFIIGAYRSNEVTATHPLSTLLEELKKRNVTYETLNLGPLALRHVAELLADTLHQNQAAVQSLADVCHKKTDGNPFFLTQLLLALYKENLIEFDALQNNWVWDGAKIQRKDITANVVDLMVDKLSQLPQQTQKALQLAACIGSQFQLELLSNICNKDPEMLVIELQTALNEGYILSYGESYRASEYHFAHDRIQQAANSMIDEQERKLIHLNLARLLLKLTPKEKFEEVIFDIVNHYNAGIEGGFHQSIDETEKRKILDLNLFASKIAKTAAAFEPALKYSENAILCVSGNMWKSDYELMMSLYIEATENAYLCVNYEIMEKYAIVGLENQKNILDVIRIIQTQVYAYVAQSNHIAALDYVIDTLKKLGMNLPRNPNMFQVILTIIKTKFFLLGKNIAKLADLPAMTDPFKIAAVNLMTIGTSSAYQGHPNMLPLLVCSNILLSAKYGYAKQSPYSYASYGIIACGILGEFDAGYQFGELAFNLLEKINEKELKTKVAMLNYCFIKHWKEPIDELLPKLKETYKKGLDSGDFEYGCYCIVYYCLCGYLCGAPLNGLLSEIENRYEPSLRSLKQSQNYTYLSIFYQAILNLLDLSDPQKTLSNPDILVGKALDENKLLGNQGKTALYFLHLVKLSLAYLFDKKSQFAEHIKNCEKYEDASVALFTIPALYFYKSLALFVIYTSTDDKKEKRIILLNIKSGIKKLAKWSKSAPSNHLHKYYLLRAEYAWYIRHDIESATKFYDQAIETAKENAFLNEEAIANECAAKFYIARGKNKVARVYLEDARYSYSVWGANVKVAQLDELYPHLLNHAQNDKSPVDTSTTTLATYYTISRTLDIDTMQKSSQSISNIIILDELLKQLMRIVIENAGAQRSFLLLNKDGKYVIEAEGDAQQEEIKVLQSIPMTNDILCVAIVNYIIRKKEPIMLDDAAKSGQFINDPYIERTRPKSILCLPLLNQGNLSGILYLENNLTEKAFTKDRFSTLNLLSSQIAISVDNARLYSSTKELNEQLLSLNKAYERFLPKDFLSLLGKKSVVDVELGDHVQATMSVLFADIRNFTGFSETLSPDENFNFINSFLSMMGPIIRKHHGFIDKYIGDAIMALYPRDADDAVSCAQDMQRALLTFNQVRIAKGKLPIAIGIGINTGLLMLGTIGEANRMNATVISDTVNIASRVESLTKKYQPSTLITEDTYNQLRNPARYHLAVVDQKVLVKGKAKPIAIYGVDTLPAKDLHL